MYAMSPVINIISNRDGSVELYECYYAKGSKSYLTKGFVNKNSDIIWGDRTQIYDSHCPEIYSILCVRECNACQFQEKNIIVDIVNAEAVRKFRKWYWNNDEVPVSGGYPVLAVRDALRINNGDFIKTRDYLMDNRLW